MNNMNRLSRSNDRVGVMRRVAAICTLIGLAELAWIDAQLARLSALIWDAELAWRDWLLARADARQARTSARLDEINAAIAAAESVPGGES